MSQEIGVRPKDMGLTYLAMSEQEWRKKGGLTATRGMIEKGSQRRGRKERGGR